MASDDKKGKDGKDTLKLSLGGYGELDPDNEPSDVVDEAEDSSSGSDD